ncbi:MAG TPA: pyridoxal phosphate-dependent aminotransferase [Bryobacteraceae bacterium]|nr:pyridoxal phosphate-dependent aminotransferase [Bryobacteraceae bacterium]
MSENLSPEQVKDFIKRGFSRRHLGRITSVLAAGAALPFYNESALAQLSMLNGPMPADAVKINANENPLGPCAEAAEAIYGVVKKGGRYMYEETFSFAKTLADVEGVKPNYVLPFAGSSDPLHRAVLAFTSPAKPLIMGDPGYEAGQRAAEFVGAKVIRVPLQKDFSHDVKAMAKADPNAGLIYICNPNNPTGTITKRSDIEWLLANKPAGSILLLDEAYVHLSENAVAGSDLVAADKDVLILRTFSKIYGMAGLRAGAAIARPDLLKKIQPYGAGALPLTGMVGANTSLKVKTLVPERRKIIADIRNDVFSWMTKKNYSFVPSESNKFMVDVKRPGGEVVQLMAQEKVFIGRVWPAWPTHVRVSVGTKEEMEKFKVAFAKVMA